MAIEFVRIEEIARFHSPLEDMALVERVVERRQDPLLKHWAIGSPGLAGKQTIFFGPTDEGLLEQVGAESKADCFFCPDKVRDTTPRYPTDCLADGCLERGECFLFPNLFPIGGVHAVVALGAMHLRRLNEFPAGLLADGLAVAVEFIRRAHAYRPEAGWYTVNANYLYPAGASVVHPHLQVLGGQRPASATARLVEACQRHRREEGEAFFPALLAVERDGPRWIGELGATHWLTPFAPLGTLEVLGVVPGCERVTDLGPDDVADLAGGLSKVLAHYHRLGFSTFNFSLFSAGLDGPADFPVFVRVVARQNVYPRYRADDYFVQKLLGEELMVVPPEAVAEGLREHWSP